VKVAIDPPDSLDPHSETASIAFDGHVVFGDITPALRDQVLRFIDQNSAVLFDYWNYRIDTAQLQRRLVRI
jgi:hypothetical protein